MNNGLSLTGGTQWIRRCVNDSVAAIAFEPINIPSDSADISISSTGVWYKEGSEDYFIESLNKEFAGEADFSLSTFDGKTLLEIITL